MLPRRIFHIPVRFLSKSFVRYKLGPVGGLSKKKAAEISNLDKVDLSVETDAKKLVTYVCGSNLLEKGGEDVKIKSDSEYPDWLKRIGLPVSIEEMDPNSIDYWKKLKKLKKNELHYIKSITRTGSVHK